MMARRAWRLAPLLLVAAAVAVAGALLPGHGPDAQPRIASAASGSIGASAISITSTGPYASGDKITVTVTTLYNVQSYSGAKLVIQMDSGEVDATPSTSNTCNTSMLFEYTVTANDYDVDGISIATNAMSGTFNGYSPTHACSGTGTHSHSTADVPNTYASPQAAHKVRASSVTIVDYDVDNDRQIDVDSLAKLDAIRHDLDGNGQSTHADYATAFPNARRATSLAMGCPNTCLGYELTADLDFAGSADYANWVPIGSYAAPYSGDFYGRGHTISNLTINSTNVDQVGLFGRTSNNAVESVGLLNVNITATHSARPMQVGALVGMPSGTGARYNYATGAIRANGSGAGVYIWAGGLAGNVRDGSVVAASWSSVTVTTNSSSSHSYQDIVGGLAGVVGNVGNRIYMHAVYATGDVSATRTSSGTGCRVGGLLGEALTVNILASYAANTPTCTPGASAPAGSNRQGGLLAQTSSNTSITNSYWDGTKAGATTGATNSYGAVKTTTQLQTPTEYGTAGDFSAWNVDVNGGAADNPWHFGTSSQYPVLAFGYDLSNIHRQWGTTPPAVDYDRDDDGLIEVSSLAQLNAIRYNLNGNGIVLGNNLFTGGSGSYANAYPSARYGMGCLAGRCIGYELANDLDFDTNADGNVNSNDDHGAGNNFSTWSPLGHYGGTFHGNGHIIANLTLRGTSPSLPPSQIIGGRAAGLFGVLTIGSRVYDLGLTDVNILIREPRNTNTFHFAGALAGMTRGRVQGVYATGAVSHRITSGSSGSAVAIAGGLTGLLCGTVAASWTDVAISITSESTNGQSADVAGGIVGQASACQGGSGNIVASYAKGNVTVNATRQRAIVGGMIGYTNADIANTINASYSTGRISPNTALANKTWVGGLVGRADGSSTAFTNSYWDTQTSGISTSAGSGVTARNTSALQTPTSAAGIYSNWNVNVDGVAGNDNPWDFGANNQYPIVKFGHDAYSVSLQRGGAGNQDYDANDNNLIDIGNGPAGLAQLDAIRWDLDGNGVSADGADALAYAKAFPNLMPGMGCPDGCQGYELTSHLDLDTDDDGSTHTAGASDSDDDYHNGGAGWDPIGDNHLTPWNAVFDGQGYVIHNLFIKGGDFTGLFGAAGADAVIRGVGLPDAYIDGGQGASVGALAGANAGKVSAGWSSGHVEAKQIVGGLIGRNGDAATATVTSSYSTAAVTADGGTTFGNAGGLVGYNHGIISNSYAAGTVIVTGTPTPGGLVGGQAASGASITASYFDSAKTTGSNSNGTAQTTSALQTPPAYGSGIYTAWNVDVDNADGDGNPATGVDDPWDFGTNSDYPALKYGGIHYSVAAQRPVDHAGGNTLIDVDSLAKLNAIRYDADGNGLVSNADGANYLAAFPGMTGCRPACTGYELTADLDFDTTGDDDVADAPYANWTPLPQYSGVFDGNGYTISNLNISRSQSTNDWIGLFSGLNGSSAVIRSLGLLNPAVTVANTGGNAWAGTLVGQNHARIEASYVRDGSVTVTADALGALVGGLVGRHSDGVIIASYAVATPVAINAGTTGFYRAGGLTGGNYGSASINASFAASTVTNSATGGSRSTGGLTGAGGASSVVNSYWDSTVETTASGRGTGRSTTQLRTPTGYAGIYANWNVNADGDTSTGATGTGADDPWDFGTSSQYPVLQLGYRAQGIARQSDGATDYDVNDNNLIDIATLARLDAIRYDLDGNGDSDAAGADTTAYLAAFPGMMAGMGCPSGCQGYELTAHLDLDTDDDGSTHTAGTGDMGDTYNDTMDQGWAPIGASNTTPYNAVFDGQGYTISNLFSKRGDFTGLFGATGKDAVLRGVGLPDAYVSAATGASVGALVGHNQGAVSASWSSGAARAWHTVGGLVGRNGVGGSAPNRTATVTSSYSTAAVHALYTQATTAGGLVGVNHAGVVNSYAVGAVTLAGAGTPGGLAGASDSAATITASYYNSTLQTSSNSHGTGQTTSQLQTPLTPPATGTYAGWDTAIWDFGANDQYPILKYGGNLYGQALQRTVDYSGDNTLIDVDSLLKLNAIRWDVDGDGVVDTDNNGVVSAANVANYLAAFPGNLGCDPACTGYELVNDLDFDTTGDDDVADAPYANWAPIPQYSGVFDGNGYAISNLTMNNTTDYAWVGLFSGLNGATAVIHSVGLINPTVTASGEDARIGTLVGQQSGASKIYAAYVSGGTVTSDRQDTYVGGLVGELRGANVSLRASYNRGTTVRANNADTHAGGLVGNMAESANITASYAAASVTNTYATGVGQTASAGGLTGWYATGVPNLPTVTNSYWDTGVTGAPTNSGGGTGRTTAQLQNPTEYGSSTSSPPSIYAAWNIDADSDATTGVSGTDDPWLFGAASNYPVLRLGYRLSGIAQQWTTTTDYDANDNNLIDIATLAQLNAVRHDLDGDGGVTGIGSPVAVYAQAFPGLTSGMGCPGGCEGYELTAHLDFDTDGDGDVDSMDDYSNWDPIGSVSNYYSTRFAGNGYTISNLTINRATTPAVGLFARTSGSSAIVGVGLVKPSVVGQRDVGALVGLLHGKVAGSYSRGGTVRAAEATGSNSIAGGLVGFAGTNTDNANARIIASYSSTAVSTDSSSGVIGGLAGRQFGDILQSYAIGSVTNGNRGGLVGLTGAGYTTTASYYNSGVIGMSSSGDDRTTTQLQTPTGYNGDYSGWNVDVDGDNNVDDPWDFGTNSQYPALKYGGRSLAWQGRGGFAWTQNAATVTALTVDEEDAAGATYGVALAVAPDADVTVTITRVHTDVTVDDGTGTFGASRELTFTEANWNTPQTVTIQATGDADVADLMTTLSLSAADAAAAPSGYASISRSVDVTVNDDDTAAILLTQGGNPITTALAINEQGTAITYGVALSNLPAAGVTVSVGSDDAAVTVSPGSLAFTISDWNTPKMVTLNAPHDANTAHESVTITHTAEDTDTNSPSGYDDPDGGGPLMAVSKTLSVSVTDNDTPSLRVSESSLTLTEATTGDGHQGSFNVRLNTQPTAAVTVAITSSNSDVRLSSDGGTTYGSSVSLSFTAGATGTWGTDQPVNVQAEEDNDGDDDSASLSFSVSGGNYGSLTPDAISVTVTDKDDKGITLSETGSLAVREGAAPASYTVVLDTEPSGAVAVSVSSNNATKVSVSARSGGGFGASLDLSFNAANYDDPQTVYVQGNVDDDTVHELGIEITHSASGGGYGSVEADLTVMLTDTSTPDLIINPTALDLKEWTEGEYTVHLTTRPAGNVTVAISRTGAGITLDDGGGTFESTGSLTFTNSNWNSPQTVKVRAPLVTANATATLSHTASGDHYAGVTGDLTVNVRDNQPPSANAGDDQEAYTGQTITLDGSGSSDPDDTVSTLSYSWRQTTLRDTRPISLIDANKARARFSVPTDLTGDTEVEFELTVTDGAASDTDTVKAKLLAARPNELVSLTVTAGSGNDAVQRPLTPAFASIRRNFDSYVDAYTTTAQIATAPADPGASVSLNGDNPPAIGARAVRVSLAEGHNRFTIVVSPRPIEAGGQPLQPVTYRLNIRRQRAPRLAFEPTRLLLTEGASATYTVELDTRWLGAEVTISITSDNPDVTVSPETVSISQHDWSPRTITVTAAEDADGADDYATLRHLANGGHFNNVGGRVWVEVSDDDDPTAPEPTPTPTPGPTPTPTPGHTPTPEPTPTPGPSPTPAPTPTPMPDLPTIAATFTTEVPVDGQTVTITREAGSLAGVTLALPAMLTRNLQITIAPLADNIPLSSARFGLGTTAAQSGAMLTVVGAPAGGLELCLPLSDALVSEAAARSLTLVRYENAGWNGLPNTERRGMSVCAPGVSTGVFAAAYALPQLGPASDLTVAAGDAPGTIVLRWTPGANATRHWVAGIKQTDWDAGDYSNLIWTAASGNDTHTVSGLDSGAEYVFAVAAGRGAEWSAWTTLERGTPD